MLHLWIPEGQGTWYWSVGDCWQAATTLEQLIEEIKNQPHKQAVAYFPSRDVQIFQQTLSKTQYKQLGQEGAQYLLEEYVVLPLDQLHIRQQFQNQQLSLMAVAKERLATWQNVLQLLPIQTMALLPDFFLLTAPAQGQTHLMHFAGRLLARESENQGHSIDDLALYLDYQEPSQHYAIADLTEAQSNSLAASVTQDRISVLENPWAWKDYSARHAFNFLQPTAKHAAPVTRYAWACAWVVVAVILVQLTSDGLTWWQQKKIADETSAQAIAQYQNWFGRQGRVTEQNLKSQFESQLRSSQSSDVQALQLLSRVGPVLMQNNIFAQQLNYQNATLELQLNAQSLEILQQLQQQLSQQGLQAQLGNTQPQANGVVGWLNIQ